MRWCSIALLAVLASAQSSTAQQQADPPALTARVIAVGIPGAGALAPVGTFHPGGPFRDKAAFAAYTQPGRILDAKRILVSSKSNFGAPRAVRDASDGAVLSIDPDGPTVAVPSRFATAGDQAVALDGRVQLYTAQSPAFLNAVTSPQAASASHPAVSNPLGISINNAFGRIWLANAPQGARGIGLNTITDPGGMPLAEAPSKLAGGVFAGDITNRPQQIVPGGLHSAAVANAFVGHSPDGSKRAVFMVLTADGSLVQVHAEFGVDGLAPAGTVSPIAIDTETERARISRTGMIFNWVPDRILYIAEPERNTITAVTLDDDEQVFRVRSKRTFTAPELDTPVDLTPAVAEVANPGFASNTTLAGSSDFYVANRGNGTLVRMRQDGSIVAVRRLQLPNGEQLAADQLNGIAVSPDARRIWVTVSGEVPGHPNAPGVLLEVPAFGPGRTNVLDQTRHASTDLNTPDHLVELGKRLFLTEFTPRQGLGPLFNRQSCADCHQSPTTGGMGWDSLALVQRVGRLNGSTFDPLVGSGGPVARDRTVAALGVSCDLVAGPPTTANVISLRNAPALYGLGLIDAIPDAVIRANAALTGNRGRANLVRDESGIERIGRYGWKADTPTLLQFVGEAFRNELGITNPFAPADLVIHHGGCGAASSALKDDGTIVRAVTAYIAALPPPSSKLGPQHRAGQAVFTALGCASCHTPKLSFDGREAALYSDLLLHDLGPAMDDRVAQGQASGKEWRTSPLWGLNARGRFLHDGRATSIKDAILAHDGEAAEATRAFRKLDRHEQAALFAFLLAL
jgi:mono/diheme cytochrome c family protein